MTRPSQEQIPAPLWALNTAALAPFPIAALVYGYGPAPAAGKSLTVLLFWSATVLSFLGGVRWGLESGRARPRWTRLSISVASGVAAWGLLMARGRVEVAYVIAGHIAAFILQWLFDHRGPDVPARYPKLSTVITGAACVSLAICLDQALRLHGLAFWLE